MKYYIFLFLFFLSVSGSKLCSGQTGFIYTYAGNGTAGSTGDGGLATLAELNGPSDVFRDAAGNTYICDKGNNKIRMINTAGIISTIVGTGVAGYSGDGGLAIAATLNSPNRVWVDGTGNIYIADENNNVIRMVNTLGIISTIVGTGVSGFAGDGGPALSAEISTPTGVAVDLTGNIYISDMGNNRIRKVNTFGIISTYAGGGVPGYTVDGVAATSISLCVVEYVSVDDTGNVFFSNHGCWHFLEVKPTGLVYNVAGYTSPSFSGDCGPADSADVHLPFGICPDNLGNVYVCPAGNERVRRVNTFHVITSVAGNGLVGYTGDGGLATLAEVSASIDGVYADRVGNIYFADMGNNVIRKFTVRPYTDSFNLCPGTTDTLPDTISTGYWSSSDTGIVATTATGVITAISPGNAIIYNSSNCTEIYYVHVDTLPCSPLVCNTIAMPDTMRTCAGDTIRFSPTISGTDSVLYIAWSPTVGLSNDSILNPTLGTGITSGWYYLTVGSLLPENLVANGNFIAGNVDFGTSYTYMTTPGGDAPGDYEIGTNPSVWNPGWPAILDPSGVLGNMLIVDGSLTAGVSFWCQTITVSPGTNYLFTVWSALLAAPLPSIQVTINGLPVLTFATSATTGTWTKYGVFWNSGVSTTATICMTDLSTTYAGNDFAIDDISLQPICVATDSAYVSVTIPDTTFHTMDTLLCMSTYSLVLNGPTAGFTTFTWNTGATTSSVTATTSGTYWVLATGACVEQSDTFHVVFHTPPTVSLGNDTSLCVGDTLTLSSVQPVGSSFLWNTGNTTNSIIVTTTSNYWLTVTDSSCSTTDSIQATFHVIPVVNLGSNDTLCAGQVQTLTSPQPITATYLWSTGAVTSTISVTTTNTYWLAVTDTGCTGSDTVVVVFHSMPVVNLGNDTSLCAGDTLTLSTTNPAGSVFLWSTGSTTNTIVVTTTSNYWVAVTDSGCTTTDTLKAAFHVIPIVNLGNDTTLCAGEVLPLLSPQPITATYLWSTGGTTNTINVTTTNTYWLAVTDTGCTGSDTIKVIFHSLPVVNLGIDTGFCVGDTLNITSVQPIGAVWLWSNGNTGDSITIDATGTYWLAVTDSGCTNSDTIHVLVSPYPIVSLGNDTAICLSEILASSTSYTTGATYLWNTGSVTDTIHIASSGTYWLELTIAGCSTFDTVHVAVYKDSFTIFNRDTAICLGQVVQVLAANFDTGVSYQWIPTAGIRFSTLPDPLIAPDTSAMYVVTASSPACPSVIDSFYIDVEPNPTLFVGNDRFVCQFDTLHLSALVTPAWYTQYSYTWSPTQVFDFTNTPNVVFFSPTTTAVYLTVSTPAGCTAVDSVLITVHSGNFASISQDATICPHDSVQLIANGGASYRWHPSLYLSDSMSAEPWAHPVTTQLYSMVATSIYGCLDTLSVNITVQPNANIGLPDSVILYPGQTYQLNPLTNCVDFTWFPPAGLSSAIISSPIASPEITTMYTVFGINEYGCKASDSITVIIDLNTLLAIPNAFSPGNGPNGTLYILKLGDATLNYFRIFNRWGNKVFETNNIEQGWDGTLNGAPQPFDVYVYEIQAVTNSGTLFTKHGNVTLLR